METRYSWKLLLKEVYSTKQYIHHLQCAWPWDYFFCTKLTFLTCSLAKCVSKAFCFGDVCTPSHILITLFLKCLGSNLTWIKPGIIWVKERFCLYLPSSMRRVAGHCVSVPWTWSIASGFEHHLPSGVPPFPKFEWLISGCRATWESFSDSKFCSCKNFST